jgi:hypothetical protein
MNNTYNRLLDLIAESAIRRFPRHERKSPDDPDQSRNYTTLKQRQDLLAKEAGDKEEINKREKLYKPKEGIFSRIKSAMTRDNSDR